MARVRLRWFISSHARLCLNFSLWGVISLSWDVILLRLRHYVLCSSAIFSKLDPSRRVLGIIRPTAEVIGTITKSNHVGLLATEGTIKSQSYNMEISKLWPEIRVSGVACPLWAAIVEANEADSPGADYFVKKRIDQLMLKDADIDTIILGCTHYPLLMSSIVKNLPDGVRVVPQGQYVANSLKDYLNRHPQMEQMITKTGSCRYLTTESEDKFKESAQIFLHEQVEVTHVDLE